MIEEAFEWLGTLKSREAFQNNFARCRRIEAFGLGAALHLDLFDILALHAHEVALKAEMISREFILAERFAGRRHLAR